MEDPIKHSSFYATDPTDVLEVLEVRGGASECLHQHGEEQRQMLGASDRELVIGVEVDDFWDGVKGRAVLSQHVLAVFITGDLHVHETLAAPVGRTAQRFREGRRQMGQMGQKGEMQYEKGRGEYDRKRRMT